MKFSGITLVEQQEISAPATPTRHSRLLPSINMQKTSVICMIPGPKILKNAMEAENVITLKCSSVLTRKGVSMYSVGLPMGINIWQFPGRGNYLT
jgi:hypothetical protein